MKRYIPVYVAAALLWAWLTVTAWPQAREVWRYMHEPHAGDCVQKASDAP